MPGMEARAPERTETSSGFFASPKPRPTSSSTWARWRATSRSRPGGYFLPWLSKYVHTSVEIVNPGGTGKPSPAISARLAPLPPSRFFILALPSARPPPNAKTTRACLGRARRGRGCAAAFVRPRRWVTGRCFALGFCLCFFWPWVSFLRSRRLQPAAALPQPTTGLSVPAVSTGDQRAASAPQPIARSECALAASSRGHEA